MPNPIFSMDMLNPSDRALLKACESSLLHWAIVRPDMDGEGWRVLFVFSHLFFAKRAFWGEDVLIGFNVSSDRWELYI